MKAEPDKICWSRLSLNPHPYAIKLLEANPQKIEWVFLSQNPGAIHLLEANPDKVAWFGVSCNPNALQMLEANPIEIFSEEAFANPCIFTYNYRKMQQHFLSTYGRELISCQFHPRNMEKWVGWQVL